MVKDKPGVMYEKGTKLNCKCGEHVFTLARDIFAGEWIFPNMFTDEGQGPWFNGEKTCCRKCHSHWYAAGHFIGEIILP